MKTKRTLRKDKQAVSPVIGVIMMIAITVVISAVIAAFAFGIIGGVQRAPNAAMVIEDARKGSESITVIHHGGDAVVNAFLDDNNDTKADNWDCIMVLRNGPAVVWENNVTANQYESGELDFEVGEQLEIKMSPKLNSGDTIAIIYIPTGDILQRVKVM